MLLRPAIVKPAHYGWDVATLAKRLGLSGNLELALDAGAAGSYGGSGQTWSDLSGNGMDFYRGSGSGSDGADPTFNGTAGGLTGSEYFGFDGGDYCTLVSGSNPTWIENIHKSGANVTLIYAFYMANINPSGGGHIVIGNAAFGSTIGFHVHISSGTPPTDLQFYVRNGSSNAGFASYSGVVPENEWMIGAVRIDEADTSAGERVGILSSAASTFWDGAASGAYSSPSASAAGDVVSIGAYAGGPNRYLESGSRIGALLGWSRTLSDGEIFAFVDMLRARYGI